MASRIYIRLTDAWQVIANPRENPMYLMNTSGTTMQVWPSEGILANPTDAITHPFQIGGSIGQFHVPAEQYLYARAAMKRTWNIPIDQQEEEEGGESGGGSVTPEVPVDAIIVLAEEPIPKAEQVEISDTFAQLQTEVMKLANRVNANKVEYIHDKEAYVFFQRHMYNVLLGLHNDHAASSNRILDLNMRLFAAEMFILEYKQKFADVELELDKVINSTEISEAVASVRQQMSVIQNTTNAVIGRLNDATPKIDAVEATLAEIEAIGLSTLSNDVAQVTLDLSSLNNALVQLAAEHTQEEIEQVFQELIANAPEVMVEPITALKNVITKINTSLENDMRQDEEIDSKVGREDTVILTGDLNIAELAGQV